MYYLIVENVDGEDDTLFKTKHLHILISLLDEHKESRWIVGNEPVNYDEDDYTEVTEQ